MTEKPAKNLTQPELIALLEELIEKVESGEPVSFAARYQTKDGEWHDLAIGWNSDEERAAAMAKLLRVLGQLH